MPGQQGDILAPLAQRRNAHTDHVQAMVEIVAERAVAHAALQVLVRRGDHPHVRLQLLVAADPVKRSVREHAQQARL